MRGADKGEGKREREHNRQRDRGINGQTHRDHQTARQTNTEREPCMGDAVFSRGSLTIIYVRGSHHGAVRATASIQPSSDLSSIVYRWLAHS